MLVVITAADNAVFVRYISKRAYVFTTVLCDDRFVHLHILIMNSGCGGNYV